MTADTPARQPHPQRCETCTNQEWTGRDLSIPDCKKCDHTPTSGERRFVEQMGCATHTSPPAPVSIKMRMPPDLEEFWLREHDAQVAKAAREQAIEQLSDLNKYSCEEYEEANLSDNEREMRIHLEYGNRTWGIIRSLRAQQEQHD